MQRWYWLRRFVRNNTQPIPQMTASVWKKRLSIVYALLAWNALGFVIFLTYQGKGDWAKFYGLKTEEELKLSPGQQWAKTLGVKNADIYRVSGFRVSKIQDREDGQEDEAAVASQ